MSPVAGSTVAVPPLLGAVEISTVAGEIVPVVSVALASGSNVWAVPAEAARVKLATAGPGRAATVAAALSTDVVVSTAVTS